MYETSSKSQARSPIGAHTHQAALPSSFAIPAPPNNTSNEHKVLRDPRNVTSTSPHLATSRFPATTTKIALPRLQTRQNYCAYHEKSQYHIFMPSAKFTLHHRFGMISTRSEHTTTHQNHNFSCGAWDWDWPRKNPTQIHNVTATSNTPKAPPSKRHKTMHLHSEIMLHASTSYVSACVLANSHKSDTSCFHPKPCPKASPNVNAIAPYRGRLRSLRQRVANATPPPDPQS